MKEKHKKEKYKSSSVQYGERNLLCNITDILYQMAFIIMMGRKALYDVLCSVIHGDVSKSIAEQNPSLITCCATPLMALFVKARFMANENEINCDSSLVIHTPSAWTST